MLPKPIEALKGDEIRRFHEIDNRPVSQQERKAATRARDTYLTLKKRPQP